MKGSLYIGSVRGIKMYIHWTFLLLVFWITGQHFSDGGDTASLGGRLLFLFAVFACVLLHELGHSLSAQRYGINTQDITLLPIGGMARLQRIPENPMQELIVAAAGPAVNVLIALILYLVMMLSDSIPQAASLEEFMGQGIVPDLLLVNISLVVFNLIPAFPMDGGRMLRAFLAFRLDREKATRYAAGIGQIFAVGFVLLGLFNNPILMLIGVFIFLGARSEAAHVTRTAMLKEVKVAEVMVTAYVLLQEDANLQFAANELLSVEQQDFMVAGPEGNITGVLTRDALLKGIAVHGLEAPVKSVMGKSIQGIQINDKVSEIYQRMAEEEVPVVPVYDNNILKGMLTLTNIREYFLVKHAVQMFRK